MNDDNVYEMLTTISELVLMIRDNDSETDDPRARELWDQLNEPTVK